MQRPTLVSFITYAAKIVARIFIRRAAKKIEDLLGKDQFGFIKEKENIMQLRIIWKGLRT
jgi:uncharacterized membrane protein